MLRSSMVLLLVAASSAFAVDAGGDSCWITGADNTGGKVWVLCEQAHVYSTNDGGATWVGKPLPEAPLLRAVKFLDDRRGYVAGDEGTLLATDDGGNSWRAVKLPTEENLTSMSWVGDSGWIAGYAGVVLHTADGGKSWTLQDSKARQPLESIFFVDANHGWAVGWAGTIVVTADGGRNWKLVDPPGGVMWSLSSVCFRDPTHGVAVGFNGTILRSSDGGTAWEVSPSPVRDWLTSVVFDSTGRALITGDSHVLVSQDAGATWQATTPTEDRLFLSRLVRTQDAVWAVGQYGMLRWAHSSASWQELDPPVKLDVSSDTDDVSGSSTGADSL